MIEVRSWASLVEHDDVDLNKVWETAIVHLAVAQACEQDQESSEAPSFDDDRELFNQVCAGNKPVWWPRTLDRVMVTVNLSPSSSTPEKLGPAPIDPNGRDLSRRVFQSGLLNLLEANGSSFDGEVRIRLTRASNRTVIGGWTGEVFIGEKNKKKRGARGDGGGRDADMLDYVTEQLEARDKVLLQAIQANTANLHGAAAVINATRGVNAAPPWMNNGEGEGNPMWLALMQGAMGVIQSAMQGQSPANAIKNTMTQQVQHPMLGGMPGAPQLPGPTQQQQQVSYGEDQYLDEGDYDGYRVADDDLLDDELAEEDDLYEEEEEEEEERPRRKRGRKGNPLDGATPEEIERWLNDMIDNHPEKRGEMLKVGTKLASKLMSG